jgi:hypothetical protein
MITKLKSGTGLDLALAAKIEVFQSSGYKPARFIVNVLAHIRGARSDIMGTEAGDFESEHAANQYRDELIDLANTQSVKPVPETA